MTEVRKKYGIKIEYKNLGSKMTGFTCTHVTHAEDKYNESTGGMVMNQIEGKKS